MPHDPATSPSSESFPQHIPVMASEILQWLQPGPGQVIVDGTVGLGGHARMLADAAGPDSIVIGLDRDQEALAAARAALGATSCQIRLIHSRFSQMRQVLDELGLAGSHCILLDLGVSSLQLDSPGRGFSIARDGPLDMRMDQGQDLRAADLVARLRADELERLFRDYGEERNSRRIAKRIVEERKVETINTTGRLARLAGRPGKYRGRIHPATRIFQALRIAVNDELGELEAGLEASRTSILPGGRIAVLTFHSLEDRIVKNAFRAWAGSGAFRLLHKRVIKPSAGECGRNRRARSAKLRVVERARLGRQGQA